MMLEPTRFQSLLSDFRLDRLFNELGWDRAGGRPQPVRVGEEMFTLTPMAQKRGVMIYQCSPDANGGIPPRAALLKIEKEAGKLAHEHLLIFTDAEKTLQTWLWVSRVPGQPAATRTHTWHKGTGGEALRQKLEHIAFSLDEEEALSLTGVTVRLRDALDRDRITRAFYDRFAKEHKAFAEFIEGIAVTAKREWYASLMLNRLMFVYFIQRKGFLDGNIDYLAERLRRIQAEAGKGKFHSFYRHFLRRLFHEGLGQPKTARSGELDALLGDVPYLNGGFFAVHELEEANPEIDIPDEAFEQLFKFFSAYDWHLDDRPLASGREINPDVLGYIFEKYINQKQMGAYYTKEDITEYIAKNTVIPFLLERARERCKVAFEGEASVWKLLADDPDRYLYPAMKRGVIDRKGDTVPEAALPDFVQKGMKDANARMFDKRYNLGEAVFETAAGERGTLPTETWREYAERRSRCLALREKMQKGEIREVDDLVTCNLNIRQFMQDVIDTCSGPELLRAIWQAIVGRVPEKANERFRHGIAILDPTCGSGAFLFAALNVLEPLYEACLDRMDGFIQDASKLPSPTGRGAGGEGSYPDFRKVLDEVARHPSRRYYIYKSIILHNLFGVDIMPEAVEICKLRLFLKLVSQVDAGIHLEPLPDIDFNIRAGNTLVGYATVRQFDESGDLATYQEHKSEIKARIADLSEAFDRFREQQTIHGGRVTSEDKRALRERLTDLAGELDRYLAREYGVDPDMQQAFTEWRESHQPFHWFAEFHGVMAEGGFDVVIGNPPYIATRSVTDYTVRRLSASACTDIYAWCLECVVGIANRKGRTGMIVPLSLSFSDGFDSLRQFLYFSYKTNWFSSFAKRPSMLFTGVQIRNVIHLGAQSGDPVNYTTRIHRWYREARPHLFQTISYARFNPKAWGGLIPKLPTQELVDHFELLLAGRTSLATIISRHPTEYELHFKKIGYNWISFGPHQPPAFDRNGSPTPQNEFGISYFNGSDNREIALLLLNGKIAFAFWVAVGDDFHLTKGNFADLPLAIHKIGQSDANQLRKLAVSLRNALGESVTYMTMHGKRLGNFNLSKCRHVTDQSDAVFARVYGFDKVWNDVELLYVQTVKTNFDEQGGTDGEGDE